MQNSLSKPIIKEKIENLEKYFSKYNNESSSKTLEEVGKKLDNQEYKIAVVANMSSGKSTFINALFGKEVLPTFNHATTDCATYIYSRPDTEIKAKIFFTDDKDSVDSVDNLEREIKQYAQKDEDCEDDRYKNVERIELYYPFQNLQTSSSEDFSITLVDTPGPNSTGEYSQKHKDQTRSVLNSVDMALFMFDYGQLDANLKSDEQGLWHTVKTRHDRDPNFEVFFLVNKIDMAMEDNFKDVKSIQEAKSNWGIYEKKATEKLKNAANSYGVSEPKIYSIASKFALLDRDDISWDSPLESFQKKFRHIFTQNWEEEYIKYLGISKLEDDINNYINTSVKEKILKIVLDNINEVENDELRVLNEKIQVLSKPKAEAEKNINDALAFLDGEAKELEKSMLERFKKSEDKCKKQIEKLIIDAIHNELYSKVDEMSKIAIAYAKAVALGSEPKLAEKRAKENFRSVALDGKVEIDLDKSINISNVLEKMQSYIKSLFDEYKNNYLDVKTDLKNYYADYEREITKIFRQTKEALNSELQDALQIDIKSVEMKTIDVEAVLNFDVQVPESVLDYKYQEEKVHYRSNVSWWNPFSWFSNDSRVVDQEEKHLLVINPIDLKNAITNNMVETIEKFSDIEQKNYLDAIVALKRENSSIFQDFRINKQKEIDLLQENIKNSEHEIAKTEAQLQSFRQFTKEQ